MLMTKKKIFILLLLIGVAIVIFIFYNKSRFIQKTGSARNEGQKQTDVVDDTPKIVSTKPDPLEDTIISATEIVEISFNRPLENIGEFKSRIEPKIDYKIELSSDRKTAKIIPSKPYPLGTTFTLFIGPETKFDGVGRWGEEKIYHFRTIKYTGV